MSESGSEFERPPHPIGWLSAGRGGGQIPPAQPAAPAAASANAEPGSAGASSGWRSRTLAASAIAALALGVGGLGAVVGHEFWVAGASLGASSAGLGTPNEQEPFAATNNPFGANSPFGSFGNGSGSASGSGAPTDIASIAAKVDPALVDVNSTFTQGEAGAGTGIVLSSNGEVLTNNHVIDGATKISVTDIGNGKTYDASVVGYDPTHDIAVLQLQGASGLRTASLGDSAKLTLGEPIVAIGNAGGAGGVPSSVGGSITSLHAAITAGNDVNGTSEQLSGLVQTNAPIQPGDSGGPLVDSAGQVIGMDTAASEGFSFSAVSDQAYAIPIDAALSTAQQIEAGSSSADVHVGPTALLGVYVPAASESSESLPGGVSIGGFGFSLGGSGSSAAPSSAGVTISGVVSGGPADKSGLTGGDEITTLNGASVDSGTALSKLLLPEHPGDKVTLGWTDTSGQPHTTSIVLASGPPA